MKLGLYLDSIKKRKVRPECPILIQIAYSLDCLVDRYRYSKHNKVSFAKAP